MSIRGHHLGASSSRSLDDIVVVVDEESELHRSRSEICSRSESSFSSSMDEFLDGSDFLNQKSLFRQTSSGSEEEPSQAASSLLQSGFDPIVATTVGTDSIQELEKLKSMVSDLEELCLLEAKQGHSSKREEFIPRRVRVQHKSERSFDLEDLFELEEDGHWGHREQSNGETGKMIEEPRREIDHQDRIDALSSSTRSWLSDSTDSTGPTIELSGKGEITRRREKRKKKSKRSRARSTPEPSSLSNDLLVANGTPHIYCPSGKLQRGNFKNKERSTTASECSDSDPKQPNNASMEHAHINHNSFAVCTFETQTPKSTAPLVKMGSVSEPDRLDCRFQGLTFDPTKNKTHKNLSAKETRGASSKTIDIAQSLLNNNVFDSFKNSLYNMSLNNLSVNTDFAAEEQVSPPGHKSFS